jgi:RNA polymerase sigma-70 factor (ECF subfamily)
MKDIDLIALVRKIKKNDSAAFEIIVDYYYPKLQCFCKNLLNSNVECEEVIEEVFVSLWEQREQINKSKSLPTLLYDLLKNEVFATLKNEISSRDFGITKEYFIDEAEELSLVK